MKRLIVVVGLGLSLAACSVRPTNPFDSETPEEAQQRAQVSGVIQAVVDLAEGEIVDGAPAEGEVLIEASFCGAREGD